MSFSPDLAEIRFGYGLSPALSGPASPHALLDGLEGPDTMAARFPVEHFAQFRDRLVATQTQYRIMRDSRGTDAARAAENERRRLNRAAREDGARWMVQTLLRAAHSPTAFRERLVAFWGDHFTAMGKSSVARRATGPYWEDAIRPRITGRFADLLKAVVTHPLMLHYLDQDRAVGPNSQRARKRGGAVGLNENLAREVLELHTLGVDGPYTQKDVRQLAELFTGLTFRAHRGFEFRPDWAEPGKETVLGRSYGPDPGLGPVMDALEDLAGRPATARHIARKLAIHFVSDTPPDDLVAHLATRFRETDGDLRAVYAALLEHPATWGVTLSNAKPPIDFVASALRALNVSPGSLVKQKTRDLAKLLHTPLQLMGQLWQRPSGPDGWPEDDAHWITPQGLAWRMQWAMSVPERLADALPDPRRFVDAALGSYASDTVLFAAGAAESRSEAIGLVLMSPAFLRR